MLLNGGCGYENHFRLFPLYRSSVDFDRMLNTLAAASRVEPVDNGPPYDIAKLGEDEYRITMAVAGFLADDLAVFHERTILEVAGENGAQDGTEYLHRGIAGRAFRRRFELADHVKVAGASLVNGLLTVDLRREVLEEMKPRRIEIAGDSGLRAIESPPCEAKRQAA